jgi:hypothetical protein
VGAWERQVDIRSCRKTNHLQKLQKRGKQRRFAATPPSPQRKGTTMLKAYAVSYDLRTDDDPDYTGLIAELKRTFKSLHILESMWLIVTAETPAQVYDRIKPHLHERDFVFVNEVGDKYAGWLPMLAVEWIRLHVPPKRPRSAVSGFTRNTPVSRPRSALPGFSRSQP